MCMPTAMPLTASTPPGLLVADPDEWGSGGWYWFDISVYWEAWGWIPGGGGSPPPPPMIGPPLCIVSVSSQSAVFAGDPFKHTYTEVQSVSQTPAQAQFLEGEPVAKNPSDKNGSLTPQWLNGFNDAPLSSNSSTLVFSFLEPASICDSLVSHESKYPNNTVTYNNWFPWSGPNSNSWTHSLLLAAGITGIPDLSNLQYPGWSNTSVPFP